MKTPIVVLSALVLMAGVAAVGPRGGAAPPAAERGAGDIESLRALGPAGLVKVLERFDAGKASEAEVDAVAGQFSAKWARLYWYTDLEKAEAAAKAEGKPILYLRLLGNLTDEYSCANSRFFRTVLYANESVSRMLREKFVLVWGSERPVPVLTIDYGDGRVLKRTITGNSAHYVLTAAGDVVDVLPGLIDPVSFARLAAEAGAAAVGDGPARATYAKAARARAEEAWAKDLAASGPAVINLTPAAGSAPTAREAAGSAISKSRGESGAVRAVVPPPPPPPPPPPALAPAAQDKAPDAQTAGRAAMGKTMVERPLTRAVVPAPAATIASGETGLSPETVWAPIARLHAADAALDASSLKLMRAQNPGLDEAAMARVVARFQEAVALDTARNLHEYRRRILGWLAETPSVSLEDLNRRVYAELFLTPRSDPWLGLAPADTYSALGNDGVCTASPAGGPR